MIFIKMRTKTNIFLNVLFLIILCTSIIPMGLALDDIFIPTINEVKQYNDVTLPQSGSNGTTAWSYCNITTVYSPSHVPLVMDQVMTKRGASFNYTLSGVYTSALGTYIVEGFCGDGYNFKPFAYKFLVTTTGGASSISLWIALLLIIISIIFLILAILMDNEYLGFITGILFVVSGIYVMIYGFGNMADLYTRTIGIVLISLGFLVFFVSAFYAYDDPEASGFKKLLGLEDNSEPTDEHDYFNKREDED